MTFHSDLRVLGPEATAAAFPFGGIGTGNVSLGARGDFRDWEIFNRPDKGTLLPNTFFAIRIHPLQAEPITRVIEGPVQPPHLLSHGYNPSTEAGLPRFTTSRMQGTYPIAAIEFGDEALPIQVRLEAFTPLIPLDPEDSGIPCAVLGYEVTNQTRDLLPVTVVGSLTNPVGGIRRDKIGNILENAHGKSIVEYRNDGALRGLYFSAEGIEPQSLHYGSMALTTTASDVTYKTAWLRGGWWDYLQEFWTDFHTDGLLDDLGYATPNPKPDTSSLGIVAVLEPGETRMFRFILSWHFPNRVNSWNSESSSTTRNFYATRFHDAWDVARYTTTHISRLQSVTYQFRDALFGSTVPGYVLDALSANIVPVRSNTCFWLENGRFYGWEGCFSDEGCCSGTCNHVWSYAQTVAFLFPSLERKMREIEFQVETEPDGFMPIRNFRAFDDVVWAPVSPRFEAASDGQMGSILRAYREWLLSGDQAWLSSIWPGIKRALDYASAQWDLDGDHVLDGKQHNTYDIEFYGPNPLSGIYYLAGLRAVEAMALVLDEPGIAERCREAFVAGSHKLDQLLWNGEYYIQHLEDVDAYLYQHGKGCLADQLLGQLQAHVLGLGPLLPEQHIRTAIYSVYKHNFRTDFQQHINVQRTYVLNHEAGLLLCTWPHGGRPKFPFVYSDEVWTGIEYHVAAHLIYEGWVEEGLSMVRAVRDRHDGIKRNPWNEVECGDHYARSMASWALLLALSGIRSDVSQRHLTFEPIRKVSTRDDYFQIFWSNGVAWGVYLERADPLTGTVQHDIQVLGGDPGSITLHQEITG